MNKVVNIFSFFLLAVFILMAMVVIMDLSISNLHLRAMPYKFEIFTAMAFLIFFVGVIRIRRHWQGIKDMKSFKQFNFSGKVAKTRMNRGAIHSGLEVAFMFATVYLFFRLSQIEFDYVITIIAVMSVLAVESLIFFILILKGGDYFKVGVNDNVIAYFDREMKLFYYEGLRRVELYQSDLITLTYKDNMTLFIPTSVISKEDIVPFRDEIIKQLDEKNIYFDDAFRNWE